MEPIYITPGGDDIVTVVLFGLFFGVWFVALLITSEKFAIRRKTINGHNTH